MLVFTVCSLSPYPCILRLMIITLLSRINPEVSLTLVSETKGIVNNVRKLPTTSGHYRNKIRTKPCFFLRPFLSLYLVVEFVGVLVVVNIFG